MRQTQIPGTEPPASVPEIDLAIEAKHERLLAAKLAREAVTVSDAKLLELMEEHGRAEYPYLEPGTGKRRVLRVDAAKRLRTVKAPSAKQERQDAEWEAARDRYGQQVASPADQQPTDDPRAADPFAATEARWPTRMSRQHLRPVRLARGTSDGRAVAGERRQAEHRGDAAELRRGTVSLHQAGRRRCLRERVALAKVRL